MVAAAKVIPQPVLVRMMSLMPKSKPDRSETDD
jgi:hypothetical protein